MPKNIVLCADGTGNSSGALFTTNVWRLYLALDSSDPERQVAFYHDGVGTSSIRALALVTGAVGYGLKRNVLEIYRFLCRTYQPGDRIFGFGFSRGSFTIRVLMGLVAKQGLVRYSGNEAQLAHDTSAAYREYRRDFHTATHVEWLGRKARDLVLALWDVARGNERFDEGNQQHPDTIQFVGVWDTVDAYGGPIEEISDGIDYWLFPLSLRDLWLPAKVQRACHALALDEERQSFWPRLWHDGYVKDASGKYYLMGDQKETQGREGAQQQPPWTPTTDAELLQIREPLRDSLYPLRDIDKQRLTQVWFAGVHSDVGGGYSKAGLSYVTLEWMMHRAVVYGLLLNPHQVAHLQAYANKFDEMNDSRRGVGTYYRYKPRKHVALYKAGLTDPVCVQAWNQLLRILFIEQTLNMLRRVLFKYQPPPPEPQPSANPPIIHQSVFDRIKAGANAYAPIVLPANYRVARYDGTVRDGPFGTPVADPAGVVPALERVWNLVWFRRVMYFATLLATLALVAIPPLTEPLHLKHTQAPSDTWFASTRVASVVGKVVDFAERTVLPKFAAYWIDPAKKMPTLVVILAVLLIILIWESGRLKAGIGTAMGQIWQKQLDAARANKERWSAPWPANTKWVWRLRTCPLYLDLFDSLRSCILPTLVIWAPIYLLVLFEISRKYPEVLSHIWPILGWLVLTLVTINVVIIVLHNLVRAIKQWRARSAGGAE